MPFTYSSGVLTQANGSTKTITAVASVTGGIQVTCASHGFTGGAFIVITGTTDYDGIYSMSGATTNTFEIVNQARQINVDGEFVPLEYTSSQTGSVALCDGSLSTLTGLTGVTKTTVGGIDIYDVGTNQVVINGDLYINPESEKLTTTETGMSISYPHLTVNGTLLVGRPIYDKWVSGLTGNTIRNQVGVGIRLASNSSSSFDTAESGLWVASTGTLKLFGGIIQHKQPLNILAGSTFESYGTGAFYALSAKHRWIRTDIGGTDFNVTGEAAPLNMGGALTFSNIKPDLLSLNYKSGGVGTYPNYLSKRFRNFDFRANSGAVIMLQNPVNGSDAYMGMHETTTSYDAAFYGAIVAYREVKFIIKDSSGTAITDGTVFVDYTDDGSATRIDGNGLTLEGVDNISDTVDGSGEVTLDVTLATWNRLSDGGTTQAGVPNEGLNAPSYWNKNGDNTDDIFDGMFVGYGYSVYTFQNQSFRGEKVLNFKITPIPDLGITETTKATVASYTGISASYASGILTVTITGTHTEKTVYDWIQWYCSENPDVVWANGNVSFASSDGSKRTFNHLKILVSSGGSLTLDNDTTFDETCDYNVLSIEQGAITIGSKSLVSGQYVYTNPVIKLLRQSTGIGGASWNPVYGGINNNGGTLTQIGGRIETGLVIQHKNTLGNYTWIVDNGEIKYTSPNKYRSINLTGGMSGSSSYDNLILSSNNAVGVFDLSLSSVPTLATFTLKGGFMYEQGVWSTDTNISDLDTTENIYGIDIGFDSVSVSGTINGVIVTGSVQAPRWMPRAAIATQATRTNGYGELRRQLTGTLKNTSGTGLTGKAFTRDTDNGNRVNQQGHDNTADKEYEIAVTAGVITTTSILLEVYNRYQSVVGVGTYDTAENRIDRRSKQDVAGDVDQPLEFDILFVTYGYTPQTYSDVNLLGTGDYTLQALHFADLGITETVRSTVAAYTGFSSETEDSATITTDKTTSQVYDRRKYLESEYPVYVWDNSQASYCSSGAGLQYDFAVNYNLILQATLSGKKITGANITLDSGWGITCPIDGVTLTLPTATTYDLRNVSISGTLSVVNTSGTDVYIKVPIGTTVDIDGDTTIHVEASASPTYTKSAPTGALCAWLNITQSTLLAYGTAVSDSYSETFTVGVGQEVEVGDSLELWVAYWSGTTYSAHNVYSVSAGVEDQTVLGDVKMETFMPAIDGSAVTGFTIDGLNIQIDTNNDFSMSEALAFLYWKVATDISVMMDFFGRVTFYSSKLVEVDTIEIDSTSASTIRQTDGLIALDSAGDTIDASPTSGGGGISMKQYDKTVSVVDVWSADLSGKTAGERLTHADNVIGDEIE